MVFMEVIRMKGNFKKSLVITIVLIELIIYISFIYIDFTNGYSNSYSTVLKYIGILLSLALSLLIGDNGYNKKDTRLLQLALCFTAAADLCLLILDYYTVGVLLFCFVQITYIIRHAGILKNNIKIFGSLIFVILVFVMILDTNIIHINIISRELLIIGCIYAILLISSVYSAWRVFNRGSYTSLSCYLICIGMTLFFLCDINVAISALINNVFIFGVSLKGVSRFLVWIYYLPAQVLLALSGYRTYGIDKRIT